MSEVVDCIAFIIRKAFWSLWVFLKFVFLRILDFFGLIFNILACLTLLRFPVMVQQFMHMQSMWEWRFVGLVQLLIFISDIPFIVMAILMTLLTFGFVLISFCKELKKEDVGLCDYFCPEYHNDDEDFNLIYDGFTLRKIIAEHFFKTICDILCLPMALICLCSWRCVIFVRQFKKSYTCWSHWTWRATAAVQFLQLMVDIPCIILGIILLPTWRFPFLVRRAKNKKWNTYRLFVFEEACLLIIDLFCFVAFLFAMVTWRGPFLVYKLYKAEPSQWKYRKFVFEQAGLVFVDIPCILCAAIIFVTLWRIRPFINNFSKNEWKVRRNCFVQLGMLLVDFACFVIGMVVVITLWRCYPLIRDVRKYCKPKKTSCEESESCKEVAESVNPEIEDGQDSHSVSEEGQGTIKVTISYTPEFRIQTWKIRKAIIKHFLFLFIDIPAIALCFLIFLTVIRFPKLLSKLLQSGAFYMEFALIAYSQAGKLIVDILFLCLFVVLMILRPIQSWIHLLEDEEHKKNRLLRFYSKFVPDIFSKRHQMYRELEEVFSNCLKIKMDYHTTRYHLSLISLKYLGELQWIRNKLKKHELDKEYDHMVHMIFWWEAKRAHKLSRLYRCELNYLAHPDVAIHNRNLLLYRNEMLQYESELQRHYRQLQEYVIPKVPLWTNQTGLMTRTRNETQRVLIRCLPSGRFLITMLILFNLLFIYRFPTLIRNLWGHWYNRRKIVFASTKQYLYDFLTILRIIVVLLLIYRAPFLITDIIRDLFYVRSWRAVRETAKRYPPWILDDLREMMKAVLSWKSVRFIITTMLFGLFMPAELFLTAIKLLGCNKCLSFLFTGILYIIFVGFPFVFSFYIGGKLLTIGLGSELTIIVGIFGAILILVLAGMATTLLRDHEGSSLKPVPYDYLRFNWSNMHVIIFEIVEYLQLLALVFAVADLPMVGAQVLNSASRYLLLNFASFQVKLWITFVLFIVWFFCVGAPVIFEQILESIPRGTCAKNIGWTLLVALLGNTLFVTMVESLISMLVCKYDKCEMGSSTVDSSTSMCATLYDEPNIKCWRGGHQAVAFFGLFGLVWYATTSIIFGTKYGDVTHPNQDFSFAPIYNTFVGFTKAVMVGIVVLAVSNTYLTVIALLILNLFALIFTVVFQKVFKYPVSNSFGLSIWRSVGFLSGVVASVAAIVAKVISNPQSSIPLIILCVCVPVVLFLAFVFSLLKKITTTTEEKRRQFRFTLLKLEKELVGRNQMVNSWSKQRKQWRRLVKNVFEAQPQENRIIQNVLNMHHFDVVTGERVTEDIEGEALDRESFAQQRDSTVDLPPPPSYDELFPNIRGEFDVLPEHTLPPGNPSIEIVHSDPKRPLEESLSARQLNNESSTTLSNKSQLPSPMSGTTESGTLATGESFIGACTKLEDTCTLPAEASLSESPTGQTRSDTGPTVEPLAGPHVEEEFTSALELGSQSEQSHSETVPSVERLAVPQPSEIIAALNECYNAPQIVEQCGSRYNVEICEEFSRTRAFNSLTKLECSGSNLLLLLEHHIHYSAFSFTFVSQLSKWRRYVRHSNWIELLHGLQLLEASITDTFNNPSRADLIAGNESSEAVFKLSTDPDNEVPPTFAPEPQDSESLQAHSKAMRSRALQDISTIEKNSQEWVQLLDKILPPIPVIVNWVWNTDSTGTSFEILFRRSVQGSVANTGPKGIKMAKGASIVFPKRIRGCFTGSGKKLTFAKGFEPKGKKGPIIVTIKELGIKTKNSKLYITTQDKRLRFDKALDSIHVLTWK